MMESDDEPVAMAYAAALADWGDAGCSQAEVVWDACCTPRSAAMSALARYAARLRAAAVRDLVRQPAGEAADCAA